MPHLAINSGPKVREKPFPSWPVFVEPERNVVSNVAEGGRWGGVEQCLVFQIEQQFAAFYDCDYGVSCKNSTHSLKIALQSLGVIQGEEVIMSPYASVTSATAVLLNNAVPIFVDIDPETYLIDPLKIESAITPRTKAIMAVHIAGVPCDMDTISHIAKKHGLRVIEDCAQALGAEWAGQRVGSFGDVGVFSFLSSKTLTCGESGMVVTNDQEISDLCKSIHDAGCVRGGRSQEHSGIGSDYCLSESQAALLLAQMSSLPEQMLTREANADYLKSKLEQIVGINTQKIDPKVTSHGYYLFVMRYNPQAFSGVSRDRFVQALCAEGIPCSKGYLPLYKEAVFTTITGDNVPDYSNLSLPVCENASSNEAVWITQGMLMGTRTDMDAIVEAIAKLQTYKDELAETEAKTSVGVG